MPFHIYCSILFFFLNQNIFAYNCTHTKIKFTCIEYVSNYDGDTIKVNIPNIHPLLGQKINLRLNGIDTPELRSTSICERKKALLAKNFIKIKLEESQVIELKNSKRGKYFRIVGDLYSDGVNLANLLIKEKLAVPYDGKKKDKIDWCSF